MQTGTKGHYLLVCNQPAPSRVPSLVSTPGDGTTLRLGPCRAHAELRAQQVLVGGRKLGRKEPPSGPASEGLHREENPDMGGRRFRPKPLPTSHHRRVPKGARRAASCPPRAGVRLGSSEHPHVGDRTFVCLSLRTHGDTHQQRHHSSQG